MVFSAMWSVYDAFYVGSTAFGEVEAVWAFAASVFTGVAAGLFCLQIGRGSGGQLGRREALLLVALSWLVGAALSALPFRFWAAFYAIPLRQDPAFASWVNCYFEAMSGLTTTGATVLSKVSSLPDGLLFWRAFTHWLGGLGIVVLFVSVFPNLGVGGKRLFKIEATGPSAGGVTPRIQETARLLWYIYLGLTTAEILALRFVGDMSWFRSITHTFATLATGGFSTVNESIGGFKPIIHWIVIVFMVLAGINFGIYHQILRGRWRQCLRSTELRAYLLILLTAAIIISIDIHGTSYPDTAGFVGVRTGERVARDAVFQVVSMQTTTGFCTADFNQWSFLSKFILIVLMFVGGCGGSTGGGIKVIRILTAAKVMWAELERTFRPNVVRPIHIGENTIDDQQRLGIVSYVLGIVFLFCIGSVFLMVSERSNGINGITATTASIAMLNNIGPGLARVGALENYAWFSDTGKLFMCLLMAVGRLEVFAILVIFMPRFWRTE